MLAIYRASRHGYGTLTVDGKSILAHRYAWLLTFGKYPEPCGLHKCDNPSCCNPDHLFEGTKGDNNVDTAEKGRDNPLRGADVAVSKLTEAKAITIRASYAIGKHQHELAEEYGVNQSSISEAIRGITWSHVKENL